MKQPEQMCVVEVAHVNLVLPALKGLELVKLLQACAARGEWDYRSRIDGPMRVDVQPIGEIRLTVVQATQLRGLQPAPAKTPRRSAPLLLPRD